MKAAVFSDTHSNTALMLEAVRRCRPDAVLHLGAYDRDTEGGNSPTSPCSTYAETATCSPPRRWWTPCNWVR